MTLDNATAITWHEDNKGKRDEVVTRRLPPVRVSRSEAGVCYPNALRLGPDALQALMRHKSYLMTKRYIHMARQLDGAVQQLHVPALPEIAGK